MTDPLRVLLSGAAEVVPEDGLVQKLALGRPLRVKLGLDPTAADVTLGWAVVLRKLRQFQDLGHTAVLIVGDFTARVGDPSGKSEARPRLSKEAVQAYAHHLLDQFREILSEENLEVRSNSEWLEPMAMQEILRLTSSYTVARMLERDDFANRYAAGRPISVMEFLYPLLQAYDSVAVQADVELGGSDQKFNLLVGREIQRDYGQDPQVALTMPLLVGTDGVAKMSQSLGNYVGVSDEPDDMFGKIVRVPDQVIVQFRALCLDFFGDPTETDRVREGLEARTLDPWQEKRRMAREIVDLYHGDGAGVTAEEHFDLVHKEHEIPEDLTDVRIPDECIRDGRVWPPKLLAALGLASSNSQGRRLIEQGGVRLDGELLSDPATELPAEGLRGRVLQVGRRRFLRLR